MAKVNFYLKNKQSKSATLIYLYFSYGGVRLKYSSREKIKPSEWNFNRMRVKKSVGGSSDINNWLDKLESSIKEIYRKSCTNNDPVSKELLREKLDALYNPQNKKPTLFSFC